MRQKTFNNNNSTLYLVATPIGNLSDFSKRAIDILSNVEIIACEDTRETIKLLNHYKIKTPLFSCHEHNEKIASLKVIEILKSGLNVAYVSDAGYPIISDPGSLLVKSVLENGFNVSVVPGASAFLSALVASNLPCDRFTFYGFLQSKTTARKKELLKLKDKEETIIFYESPYRVMDTLKDLLSVFGDRKICLARELTKKFEEYIRGNISEVIEEIKEGIKGEIVLVVSGKTIAEKTIDNEFIVAAINDLVNKGATSKDAINIIAKKHNLKKNDVYNLYHLS